jgi:hypothetical protein
MATNVTVITNSASTVSIRPSTKTVASVSTVPSSNITLGSLSNVNTANTSNGKTLVYNSITQKYEAADPYINALSGGTF